MYRKLSSDLPTYVFGALAIVTAAGAPFVYRDLTSTAASRSEQTGGIEGRPKAVVPYAGTRVTFVDPELRPKALSGQAISPIYADLRKGHVWYRQRWGALPQVRVPPGADLGLGHRGPRVRSLRQRLGLEASAKESDRFDPELAAAVREFREVHGLGSSSVADASTVEALNNGAGHYERIISANLDRLRVLPAAQDARYVLVDIAAAELRMMEGPKAAGSMRVIVGKSGRTTATPQLAALLRFAVLNPYWNVPPDIVRNSIAPQVVSNGPDYLTANRFEVLSGWTKEPRVLDPMDVDWQASANGRLSPRVRQLPGPENVMGRIKFIFPNRFGVYLHDTPAKAHFRRADRRLSHGCVRLEDADRLARWLLGPDYLLRHDGDPETRVRLSEPIPVYLLYITAMPHHGQVRFRQDLYGWDTASG